MGAIAAQNHQPHDCLLNRLFRRRSNKTSKLRVTGLCAGTLPATGEFPAQMASNTENVFIWWRHNVIESIEILDIQLGSPCRRHLEYSSTICQTCRIYPQNMYAVRALSWCFVDFTHVFHYTDVIMGAVASQITSLTIVYSTVSLDADQSNIKASRHWPLCGEFTGDRWIPRTNGK